MGVATQAKDNHKELYMPKVIDTIRITGFVSRIFFNYGDTGMTSALVMVKGTPKIFKIPAPDRVSPFAPSLKLTKAGDRVHFEMSVERSFLAGEYENLVSWTNETLDQELKPAPNYKD